MRKPRSNLLSFIVIYLFLFIIASIISASFASWFTQEMFFIFSAICFVIFIIAVILTTSPKRKHTKTLSANKNNKFTLYAILILVIAFGGYLFWPSLQQIVNKPLNVTLPNVPAIPLNPFTFTTPTIETPNPLAASSTVSHSYNLIWIIFLIMSLIFLLVLFVWMRKLIQNPLHIIIKIKEALFPTPFFYNSQLTWPKPNEKDECESWLSICKFKPSRNYEYEEEFQKELYKWLQNNLDKDIEWKPLIQSAGGIKSYADLGVDNIAIEIKGPTGTQELKDCFHKVIYLRGQYNSLYYVLFDPRFDLEIFNELKISLSKRQNNIRVVTKNRI